MAKSKKNVEIDSKAAEKTKPEAKDEIENWAAKPDSDIYEQCEKFYPTIAKAYENRQEADEAIAEYWNIYNAQPDDNQTYQGNSKCYVPVVRDAINARAKRALKQNFPTKYKHVDAIGTEGETPYPQLALIEHYIRSTKLKSLCRSLYISGDVTGQWSIYVDWLRNVRNVSGLVRRNPILQSVEGGDTEVIDPTEEEEVIEDSEIVDEGPTIVDLATEDLVVIPPTCNNIEKAHLVSVKLRMDKAEIQRFIDEGIFVIPDESDLGEWIADRKGKEKQVPEKKRTSDAGIKTEGTYKYALIYEVTARLEFEKGKKSLAYIYYAGDKDIIGIIKAPQWGQKRPVISASVSRIGGSFNGVSVIEAVKWMQWNLNDFWNMGQDSAMYSLLPIVMTDPEKNPNYAMMVYGLAAVWPVSPETTKFASFPQLWQDSVSMCNAIKAQIDESLEINDLQRGRAPAGKKNANAVGAQMQEGSVSVVDLAERFEDEILNPLVERFFEYDCQFREEDMTVLTMGEIGIKAAMQSIPPQQWENRYFFQWCGTEYVRNMQMMQQQISTMNVLRGIPPQQLNGRRLDITPILEILANNVFGSELSHRILIDDRDKYTVDPAIEDEMLVNGMKVEIHEFDDDQAHIKIHQQAGQTSGDTTGLIRTHIQAHIQQLQKKRQMQTAQMIPPPPQGAQGVPGGAGPGVAGSPRMGAQAGQQRPMQQPPGAIGADQMPGGQPRG